MKIKDELIINPVITDDIKRICTEIKDEFSISASIEDLYLYLRWGSLFVNKTFVEKQNISWMTNKGDLSYLEQDGYYYTLLQSYLGKSGNLKKVPDLLCAKFTRPIVTSDGIRYFSVANYYSSMMTTDKGLREYIASLTPFYCLRYWTDLGQDKRRANTASIRDKVMEKALHWLFIVDETVSIVDVDNINAFYYDKFPLFGIDEESRYWGVRVINPNKFIIQGYNKLGSIIGKLKYKHCYESIPF